MSKSEQWRVRCGYARQAEKKVFQFAVAQPRKRELVQGFDSLGINIS